MKGILFPHAWRKWGWIATVPGLILGLTFLFFEWEPNFLSIKMPALFYNEFIFGSEKALVKMVDNNLIDEISGVLLIIGLMILAFSKEKIEDEYYQSIRLKSLVWAVYVNYFILLISMFFIYDLNFLYVLIFNMFTILVFFLVRFQWKIRALKNMQV